MSNVSLPLQEQRTLENAFLDRIFKMFSVELPYLDNLDDYLDTILPEMQQWGEDLIEQEYFVQYGGKPWLEVTDDEHALEDVLHFFNDDGEYLRSIDGNVFKGSWRLLPNTNKIVIEQGSGTTKTEMYDLAYLDDYFFILQKRGDQPRKGNAKYLAMGYEPAVSGLEWRDYVEALFNNYRNRSKTYRIVIWGIVLVAILIIALSVF